MLLSFSGQGRASLSLVELATEDVGLTLLPSPGDTLVLVIGVIIMALLLRLIFNGVAL